VALSSSILPKQAEYTKVLNGLLGDFKYGEIEFINESPTEEISDTDLMTVWEMRESRGMSFDKLDPHNKFNLSTQEIMLATIADIIDIAFNRDIDNDRIKKY